MADQNHWTTGQNLVMLVTFRGVAKPPESAIFINRPNMLVL